MPQSGRTLRARAGSITPFAPGASFARPHAAAQIRRAVCSQVIQILEPRLLLCDHVHDDTMAMTFWAEADQATAVVPYTAPVISSLAKAAWTAPRDAASVGPGVTARFSASSLASIGKGAAVSTSAASSLGLMQSRTSAFALAYLRGVGVPAAASVVAISGAAAAPSSSASSFPWVGPWIPGHAPTGAAPTGAAPASSSPAPGASGADIPPYTLAANGMPQLESLPGAPTAIYLDFDGDTTTSTAAYDEDSSPTTFNATEQANIAEAWRQITAYFAMFDTNVTTINPSVPKSWNAIGNNISGGYAYVGTFPNTQPQAFNNAGDARTRVSGLVHENGHVFSLQHQSAYDHWGTKTTEYRSAPDTLHGPIMGVDYSGSVHKWYAGRPANNVASMQDDMAIISAKIKAKEPAGGDGYRADDYGNTIATAAPLTSNGWEQITSGILERMNDVDAFSFISTGGPYAITATPPAPSGADIRLELYAADGTRLATADNSNNGQYLTAELPAGTYYAMVSSHGDYGDTGMYDIGVRALPDGWAAAEIAPTTRFGTSGYDASTGIFTNTGSGADVWNTSDSFHRTYQQITGDTTIIGRVLSMSGTDTNAKVGLEIRDTLAVNSRHMDLVATWNNGRAMQYRTTAGGSSSQITSAAGTAFTPVWLKLVRSGNSLTGYTSSDGTSWTTIGTASVTMGATAYVGLLTTAHNASKLNTATFDNVSITGTRLAAPTYNALTSPTVTTSVPATGTGINLAWDAQAGATGYAVDRSADGITFAQIGTTTSAVLTYSDTGLAGSLRYFYRVRATDGTGSGAPSAIVSQLNRPSAVTSLSTIVPSTTSIILNWLDTDGETGYRVERSADGGATYTTLTTLAANIPGYTNTGLTVNTVYTYRVTPTSDVGDGPSVTITDATRLPTVTAQAIDSQAATTIAMHWSAVTGATGYQIQRSTDNATWTAIGTTTGNASTTYTATGLTKLTEYYFRVVGTSTIAATGATNISTYPTAIFAATTDSVSLPAGWVTADIGSVGGPGAAGFSSGTWTLLGSGADIWSTADAMRYAYQPLVGDGSIVARVASIEATNASAKIGVMIRESTAAGARNAFVLISSSAGAQWQVRSSTSGSTTSSITTGLVAPYWVKLTRASNVFTGSISSDNITWTQIGSATIAMGASALVGLADTAHLNTALNTSTIDNVTLSNAAPTIATSPSAIVAANGLSAALSVLGADDHGESNLTYTWAATTLPDGAASPTFSANETNAAKSSTATFSKLGTYILTLTATDISGLTVSSTVSVTINQVATSIAIAPSTIYVATSGTKSFSAIASDQFGAPLTAQPTITWSITAGGGSINSAGLFTAPATAQSSTIKAAYGTVSSTATANTVIPPAVTTSDFNDLTSAGAVSFTFTRDVSASLATSDLTIADRDTGAIFAPLSFSYDTSTQTARFMLPMLPNGNYRATLSATSASDSNGIALASTTFVDFYILSGDANHDRSVDLNDLTQLSNHYGASTGMTRNDGDFNSDGRVDLSDLILLANNYGTTLAPSTAADTTASPFNTAARIT